MAEKRLFHTKGTDASGNQVHEGFYQAHTVNDVREDAKKRSGAVSVTHENLTKNPGEFYRRLKEAENSKPVKHEKIRGLGHRWEVQEGDPASPFEKAADNDGGIPPSLQGDPFPLEFDPNNINPAELTQEAGDEWYTPPRLLSDEEFGQLSFQTDAMRAIGGFEVPPEEPDVTKIDTGKLRNLTEEERQEELNKLIEDPSSYDRDKDDEVEASRERDSQPVRFV